jgi:hypothetical protein
MPLVIPETETWDKGYRAGLRAAKRECNYVSGSAAGALAMRIQRLLDALKNEMPNQQTGKPNAD